MAHLAGLSALVENIANTPTEGTPFCNVVFEAWFDDHALAEAATNSLDLLGLDAAECVQPILILAEEFTQDRLRGLLA